MKPEHIPVPFDIRCVPDWHCVVLAEHDKMHSFAWLQVAGERRQKLSRRELATALFIQRACNAYYPMLSALERIRDLARARPRARPLDAEVQQQVAVGLDAAAPATPSAIAAVLDKETLPELDVPAGAGGGRPGSARRVANLLGRLWHDGAVSANQVPQVRRAHEDMLALLDAAGAGCTTVAMTTPQLVPVCLDGQTTFLPLAHHDTPTFQIVVKPTKAALLSTADPNGDRVFVGAASLAEAIGWTLMANPGLCYDDILEHLEV